MRKSIALLLCTLYSVLCTLLYAADITGLGMVTQVKNGNDTLLFFKDEIHLQADRSVDWYHTDGTLFQSDAQDIYPDDGGYYFKDGTYQSSPVYAFVYVDDVSGLSMEVQPDCDVTIVRLQGNTAPFTYTRMNGTQGTYERQCTFQYTTLSWGDEQWQDSTVQLSTSLYAGYYTLPATLLNATTVHLCYDGALRSALGLADSVCIAQEVPLSEIRAVSMHLTSLAVKRDSLNEMNRPTSQDIIKASTSEKGWSGPLEVTFYCNPTPAAQYYNWTIYHGSSVWKTRKDTLYHDFFSEPGLYEIVCKVNNPTCTSDSMKMAVAISESFLSVPNTFTPDGNGTNDEFRVAYRSIKEYHIWIYNRWGKLVYESTDPAKGWDGMIGNRPASEGAYYYVIRALGTDADKNAHYMSKISYNSKKNDAEKAAAVIGIYQLSGDINLLR